MSRDELERLSKEELIDLVLRLQRPEKTSRTSSKPPATDRKEKRENAKPGGAKPGHEGHSRTLSEQPDRVIDHRPEDCPAEKTAGGYEVAWKLAGADQYTVWNTDANGNYTGHALGVVSGSDPALQKLEASFAHDLNNDGHLGLLLV